LIVERQLPPAKVEKAVSISWACLILPKLVPINTKGLLSAGKKKKKKERKKERKKEN